MQIVRVQVPLSTPVKWAYIKKENMNTNYIDLSDEELEKRLSDAQDVMACAINMLQNIPPNVTVKEISVFISLCIAILDRTKELLTERIMRLSAHLTNR